MKKQQSEELIIKGQPISPGIAIGSAFLLDDDYIETVEESIPEENVPAEIEKFKKAIQETTHDLQLIIDQVGAHVTGQKREIFDAHIMILEDRHIINQTIEEISVNRINADYAYYKIMRSYQRNLTNSQDSYLRERAIDIRDIKRRVVRKILGAQRRLPGSLKNNVIVARELNLFDVKRLARNDIAGVILEGGGRTSHIAIIIRALELPGIIGAGTIFQDVHHGDLLVANGLTGEITVHPSQPTLKRCRKKQANYLKYKKEYRHISSLPSVTHDHKPVVVNANIEFPDEVDSVLAHGAFGIGLFRTEYDYIAAGSLPTEEEQYRKYVGVVKKLHPHPVTIRTIDLGGDKIAPFIETENEKNPFLGWRAIRICLDMPDIFKKQLRAIFRASVWGNVKLMFPLIATLDELRQAKVIVREVVQELRSQNIDFEPNIPIGIMIEVPSAVILADRLAREVDFFSIGTNDLVQYVLAVDRGNAKVAQLYNFYHPSVIRLIKMTVQAAEKHHIPVGMCGEMAGDPLATALLLGLGITEFSVSPVMMLKIKQILRSIDHAEARAVSRRCLRAHTTGEVVAYLRKVNLEFFPRMDEDYFFRRFRKS